jgi:hypothetical protein
MATRAVLPEGVGKNQSKTQRGKSKNPFFQNFFIFLIATT